MPLFQIDQKKCKRDGICMADCPAQVIAMPDKKDYPSPIENAEEFCINCGHCVAVCPHGALSLKTMPVMDCPVIQKDLIPESASVRQFLSARRSIRQYKKKQVPQKMLQDLIETARFAPTGSNKQQVHWTVFQNPDNVRHLAGLVIDFIKLTVPGIADEASARRMRRILTAWENGKDRILRGAPHLILAHAPSDLPFVDADCVTALSYLELYAYALGLGTCWAGYFTGAANMHDPLIKALALPPGHLCYGAVMLGYPQYKYVRIPKRNEPPVDWR